MVFILKNRLLNKLNIFIEYGFQLNPFLFGVSLDNGYFYLIKGFSAVEISGRYLKRKYESEYDSFNLYKLKT